MTPSHLVHLVQPAPVLTANPAERSGQPAPAKGHLPADTGKSANPPGSQAGLCTTPHARQLDHHTTKSQQCPPSWLRAPAWRRATDPRDMTASHTAALLDTRWLPTASALQGGGGGVGAGSTTGGEAAGRRQPWSFTGSPGFPTAAANTDMAGSHWRGTQRQCPLAGWEVEAAHHL